MGEGGQRIMMEGDEFNYDIFFVRTSVNFTMYLQYNNLKKKNYFEVASYDQNLSFKRFKYIF
jgi:hypothetical protein